MRLLNRATRSVVPTEAGARLIERLAPALAELEAAPDIVNAFRNRPAGTLKLNVPSAVARTIQRRQPNTSMLALSALGALGSGVFGLFNSPRPPLGAYDLGVLFMFGLTTIGLAFVLFMEGAKLIPSAEAGLISLLDVVLGPIWVFLAFGENPGLASLPGGAIDFGVALWRMTPDL